MFQVDILEKSKQFLFSKNCFSENSAAYEIKGKNIVEGGRPQTTIWRMRIACWIPTVILKPINFPIQHFLERGSMLCYTRSTLPVSRSENTAKFNFNVKYSIIFYLSRFLPNSDPCYVKSIN
jgi:hypothetical protein